MAVFIIPGFFSQKRLYNKLADGLSKKGFAVEIVDLGLNIKSLQATSEAVLKYLKKTPEKDDIIAHSFGGIVIKNIIAKNPSILKQIRSISFVAVPHSGSWSTLLVPIWPATLDMVPLRKHFKILSDVPLPDRAANFIAQTDIKIWPKKASSLNGLTSVVIPRTNHDSIINSQVLVSKISKILK